MSRSFKNVATGATLNFLKACKIPYIQPLIDVALHIYTAADTLKTNKQDAAELAECVGNTVRKIAERHSKELSTPMQQDDIDELLAAFRDVDDSLMTLSRRRRIRRWIYYWEDQEILRKHKETIGSAKLEYLFSNELSKIAQKQTETYAIYTLKDIESLRVVKLGPVRDEVGRIVQSGEVKSVLIRRYNPQSIKQFLSDIAFYSKLTHPNFPFVGASSASSPSPFMIFENGDYQHAPAFFDQIRVRGSVQELLKHATIMITDLLAALDYCKQMGFNSYTMDELIKYNGQKVILDLKPPPQNLARPITPTQLSAVDVDRQSSARIPHPGSKALNWKNLLGFAEVDTLATLMNLPATYYYKPFPDISVVGPLWPFWYYLYVSKGDRIFFNAAQKIRNAALHTGALAADVTPRMAHSMILENGDALYISIPQYRDNFELGDVGYFNNDTFIKVTNILQELRAQSIVGSDTIFSGPADGVCGRCMRTSYADDSEERWYTLLPPSDRMDFHSMKSASIHDTSDRATRRKAYKYLHDHLPNILAQQLDYSGPANRHFALVVEIDEGHYIPRNTHNDGRNLRTTKSLSKINQSDVPTISKRQLRGVRSTTDLSSSLAFREYRVRCAVTECMPD